MTIFKMADLRILDFRGPVMGSSKSLYTTSEVVVCGSTLVL